MTHVLFVDGEDEGRPLAEEALRRSDRFKVRRAHEAEAVLENGEDLLQENGTPGPDLLVSSWFLPRLNGPALAEELREAGADVPIVLLTSKEDAEARAKALRRGADECLTRPVDARELAARLEALCRRPESWEQVDQIRVGPLLIDAERKEARAYDHELDLRKKEFDFLYLLSDRRPAVVSREMLVTRVWGQGHVSDNSIDVTASGLRTKLEGAFPKNGSADDNSTTGDNRANGAPRPRVETIRGVGYRLAIEPEGANQAGSEPTGEA